MHKRFPWLSRDVHQQHRGHFAVFSPEDILFVIWTLLMKTDWCDTVAQEYRMQYRECMQKIMNDSPWIWRVFFITSEAIRQLFLWWRCHEWKSLANRSTSDKNIIIYGKAYSILFLMRYHMLWVHKPNNNNNNKTQNIIDCLISTLSLRTTYSNPVLWRHADVMSHHCDAIFVECPGRREFRNWHRIDINYWKSSVNIDLLPPPGM